MLKSLVTGGAGFIGSHLVDRLIKDGQEVTVIDNLINGDKKNINHNVKAFIEKDICKGLVDVFYRGRFDYVFHLAAQTNLRRSIEYPREDALTNIIGSINLIKESAHSEVKKFIFSSTGGAIYRDNIKLPYNEDSETLPSSPYGQAKKSVEEYLRVFKNLQGLDYVCLRYSNVYGPRQDVEGEAGVVSIFIDNILEKKPLKIFGDGKQTRDFIYVDDVVEANIRAMELSGIYNVSTDIETSVIDLTKKIQAGMRKHAKIEYKDAIAGELKRSCLSWTKLGMEGWEPKYFLDTNSNRASGLVETIKYFKREKRKLGKRWFNFGRKKDSN